MAFNRENTTQISLYISNEVASKLKDFAFHSGRSRTDIFREAIEMWMEHNIKEPKHDSKLTP